MSRGITANQGRRPPRQEETTQRVAVASNGFSMSPPKGRLVSWKLWLGLSLSLVVWGNLPSSSSNAQEVRREVDPQPVFSIPPQLLRFRSGDRVLEGQVTVRLLEAIPEDDSLRALLTLEIFAAEEHREPPGSETAVESFSQEVRLSWVKGTACPTLRLRVPALEAPGGMTVTPLPSSPLRIEETEAEISRLLCIWTRQINAGRSRLGIIRALNHLLLPADVAVFAPPPRPDF